MLFPPRGRRRRRGEGDGGKGELNVFLSLCSCGFQSGAPPRKRRQARDAGILTDRHAREEGRRRRTRFFPLPHRRGKSSAGRACFPPRCLRSLALGPLRRRREAHRRAKNKSIRPPPTPSLSAFLCLQNPYLPPVEAKAAGRWKARSGPSSFFGAEGERGPGSLLPSKN